MPDNEITPDLDEKIRELARDAPLPPGADHERFVEGLRAAFRNYVRERPQNWNKAAHEIRVLEAAARRRNYAKAMESWANLSDFARYFLKHFQTVIDIDKIDGMCADPTRRDERRDEMMMAIEHACSYGGRWVEGRLRPSGRRSRSWRPLLVAPTPVKNPRRHEAESRFVTWLEVAWQEATGAPPALSTNPEQPGPFARWLSECLKVAGARGVDPVGLLNAVHATRRVRRKRHPDD